MHRETLLHAGVLRLLARRCTAAACHCCAPPAPVHVSHRCGCPALQTNFPFKTHAPGVWYTFTARANNGLMWSQKSLPLRFKTPTKCAQREGVAAAGTAGGEDEEAAMGCSGPLRAAAVQRQGWELGC